MLEISMLCALKRYYKLQYKSTTKQNAKNSLNEVPHVMGNHHYRGSYSSVEESLGTIKYLI